MNGLNNEVNEGKPKTVVEEKFNTRKEDLLKIKKKQLEQKKGDLKKNYLTKDFLKDEFKKKPANVGPNGLITLMLGEDEKINYAENESMRIKEKKIDSKCFKMREKIKVLEKVVNEILKKTDVYDSIKNRQYYFKINSMDLKFNSLLEVINYIENLRKEALGKYHIFTRKIEEEVGVSSAELNSYIENLNSLEFNRPDVFENANDEENFNMLREDLQSEIGEYNRKIDGHNFKRIRIYGVRFKNELSKVLEKEVNFLRKLYRTKVFLKDLKKKGAKKEECEKALEKDINYAINYCARNIISSYEHLLYATPLDEVKEETKEQTEELEKLANKYGIHILLIGDPVEL